jgi:hypothetical protein
MMFKSSYKSILFVGCISLFLFHDLHAAQPVMQIQILQTADDAFIRNFVQRMGSDKVSYDGKTLILYADPGSNTNVAAVICLVVCTFLGSAFAPFLILDLVFLLVLIRNFYYESSKTPFITINDEWIEVWGDLRIRWDRVSRLKHETICTTNGSVTISQNDVVHLCDEYLNTLLKIKDKIYLPITIDNLIAILEHYIEKSKQAQTA